VVFQSVNFVGYIYSLGLSSCSAKYRLSGCL
jgi:hypothetical protein